MAPKSRSPKHIYRSESTQARLAKGVAILARVLATTYGPHGKSALLDRPAGILATKDGFSIAQEITLQDPVATMGCQIVLDACRKVNIEVGDGTTTTACLIASLVQSGHKLLRAGISPQDFFQGVREASTLAREVVQSLVIPIKNQDVLERVALLSSNGDVEIAKLLAEACMSVGQEGTISVEDGQGVASELILKDGVVLDQGLIDFSFTNEGSNIRIMEGVLVAVVPKRLNSFEDVRSILEEGSQFPQNEILILAEGFGAEALVTLRTNYTQKVVRCCPFPVPGTGFYQQGLLRDLAALSNAPVVDPVAGMDCKTFQAEWFGSLRKVTLRKESTTFIAYATAEDAIQQRISELRSEMGQSSSEYDLDQYKTRIGKLSGGMAVIQVGGSTEAALKERRGRVEDALGAVQAALRGGLVPGAGIAYLDASQAVEDRIPFDASLGVQAGYQTVGKALLAPLSLLIKNAGDEPASHLQKLRETRGKSLFSWVGFDPLTKQIRDLSLDPLIGDPAEVVLCALQMATSAALMLLSIDASIVGRRAK